MVTGGLARPEIRAALEQALANPERFQIYLIKEEDKPRTPAQNRLFRKLCRLMAQQLGGSVDRWRDFFVAQFLGCDEVTTEDGYIREVPVSTSDLTVAEFTRFLDACLMFASEKQVSL